MICANSEPVLGKHSCGRPERLAELTSTNWPFKYGFFMYGVDKKTSMNDISSSWEDDSSTCGANLS